MSACFTAASKADLARDLRKAAERLNTLTTSETIVGSLSQDIRDATLVFAVLQAASHFAVEDKPKASLLRRRV